MRYVDLSHTISDGLTTYRGLPAPIICDYLTRDESANNYEDGSTFQIGEIKMVGNSGTYLDCPFHRYAAGKDFSELFLSDMADLPGVLIQAQANSTLPIDVHHFENVDMKDKAVLIRTDWAKKWATEAYFENHPFITEAAAHFLKTQRPKIIGIDSYNVDDTRVNRRPAHSILLGADILIVEHMCQLHLLPVEHFYFSAIPPKIRGMGSLPVRAFAKF